jgi:hypothetical protein
VVIRILIFDRIENLGDPNYATIPQYFEHLRNRQTVVFKLKQKERETLKPDVELALSKKMTYDKVNFL